MAYTLAAVLHKFRRGFPRIFRLYRRNVSRAGACSGYRGGNLISVVTVSSFRAKRFPIVSPMSRFFPGSDVRKFAFRVSRKICIFTAQDRRGCLNIRGLGNESLECSAVEISGRLSRARVPRPERIPWHRLRRRISKYRFATHP